MLGRSDAKQARQEREDRDENPEQRWEYLARNLAKVPGVALEDDFNKHGEKGWEFASVANDYAIFKRRV